jgi:hypothetical protein
VIVKLKKEEKIEYHLYDRERDLKSQKVMVRIVKCVELLMKKVELIDLSVYIQNREIVEV